MKKITISISVFDDENKEKYPVYVSKRYCEEKHVDLLLIGEGEKKHFCEYCLHAFATKEILKCHSKECFEINGKQTIKMPKKCNYVSKYFS